MRKSLLGMGVFGLLALGSAHAARATVTLTNGSFETTTPLADGATTTDVPGWSFGNGGSNAAFNPPDDGFPNAAISGSNVAFSNSGYYYQDLGKIEAGETYAVTISLGFRTSGESAAQNFEILLRRDDPTSITLDRKYGPTADTSPGAPANTPMTTGVFQDTTVSYTNTLVDDVGKHIFFVVNNADVQLLADNVRLTVTPAPEPASLGVLGIGGAGLLARRRRIG